MVAAIAYHVRNANSHFCDMELKNIEALANGENNETSVDCSYEGSTECQSEGYARLSIFRLNKWHTITLL